MPDSDIMVLVVEDDFVDVESIRRGVRSRSLGVQIEAKMEGRQALEYLRTEQIKREQRERLIVFLDINMPGMNGHQFLDELRSDEDYKRTIVFVLTTSTHEKDRARAYDNHVAGYFSKSNLDGALDTLAHYVQHVEFPPR